MKPQNSKSQGLFSPESTTLAPIENSAALPQEAECQQELERQREQEFENQKALQQAEKIAYNALSRREYSTQELEEKLLRKNTPVDIVKIVLRQMRELNLQSDERFTENFVRSRINRGQGPVRIEMELKQRGISADLAEQHLAAEESFWLAQAKSLLARRGVGGSNSKTHPETSAKELEAPEVHELEMHEEEATQGQLAQWQAQQDQQKIRAGHARFLASRGFRSNTIARALPDDFD